MDEMKKIIVANWKMNPVSLKEAKTLLSEVKKVASKLKHVTTIVCPPAIFLQGLAPNIQYAAARIQLGAQDCFHAKQGAHTGAISAEMVAQSGAHYVIIGHSERRAEGETSSQVARKINYALDAGLCPILCIGEKVRDEHGFFLKYVEEQLTESLRGVSKKRIATITVAYEPLWAISNEMLRPATSEESHEMVLYIRKLLAQKVGANTAKALPILYGGSVEAKNCDGFLRYGGVQGLLVGHASLEAMRFAEILKIAEFV